MELEVYQYVILGLVLVAASVLQCSIGFASGLFSIPAMLMLGLELPVAVTVALIASALQNLVGYVTLRDEVVTKTVVRPVLIRLVTLPLGVFLLHQSQQTVDPLMVRQIVGAILLSVIAVQWCWRVEPRDKLHAGWEFLAFSVSGVMLGFCGMGGPPMVLWVMAHRWSATRSRAFMFAVFLSGMLPQALFLWLAFGEEILAAMVLGLLGTPVVFLGTLIGLRLGEDIPKLLLRQIAYVVLTLIALVALVTPLVSHAAGPANAIHP